MERAVQHGALQEALLDENLEHTQGDIAIRIDEPLSRQQTCSQCDRKSSDGIQLRACDHYYCVDCFKAYCELKVSQGQMYPACFHRCESDSDVAVACGVPVTAADIQEVFDEDHFTKWRAQLLDPTTPAMRTCPQCRSQHEYLTGHVNPSCVCPMCNHQFCFFHADWHSGSTCGDFEMRVIQEERRICGSNCESTSCVECKSRVFKHVRRRNRSCGIVTCQVCSFRFCWTCKRRQDGVDASRHCVDFWMTHTCLNDMKTPRRLLRHAFTLTFDAGYLTCIYAPASAFAAVCTLAMLIWMPCVLCRDRRALRTDFFDIHERIENAIYLTIRAVGCVLLLVVGLAASMNVDIIQLAIDHLG